MDRISERFEEGKMIGNYLKTAVRTLLKHKTYSLINILGLAIGIAACLIITLYVMDDYGFDRYHPDADRIFRVVVDVQSQTGNIEYATTPASLAHALKRDYPQVEHAARLITNPELMIRSGTDKKFTESRIFHADPEIFEILHLTFVYGDPQTCLNRPGTVVITQDIARKYFGDRNPLGERLDFGYAQFEVAGVIRNIPSHSHLRLDFLLSAKPFTPNDWRKDGWGNIDGQQGLTYTYVKLSPNCDVRSFESQIRHVSENYPGGMALKASGEEQSYSLQAIRSIHLHSHRRNEVGRPGDAATAAIFSLVAALTLIIACLNFINLTTARSMTRAKEVSVRQIMGAVRAQLIKQFLGESMFLCVVALLVALFAVALVLPIFNSLLGKTLSLSILLKVGTCLPLMAVVSFVGLASGTYPALLMTSVSPVNLIRGKATNRISGMSIRKALVGFQFFVTIVLMIGAMVVYDQLHYMKHTNLGFDKERLLVLPVPVGSLFDPGSNESISNEFKQHHSILSVTTTSCVPGMEKNLFKGFLTLRDGGNNNYDMNIMMVDHYFLSTYSIPLVAGKAFQTDQPPDMGRNCIINEAAVKAMGWTLPEQAVGKTLFDFDEREIIGVVKDFHYQSLQHRIEPLFLGINPDFNLYLTLRLNTEDLPETMSFIQRKWDELFPSESFVYHFLDDVFDRQYRAEEQFNQIILAFSALAMIIACLGLFALTLFAAQRSTKEIGVRKVLGASATSVFLFLTKDFLTWIPFANFIAWPIAWYAMNKWLQNFAYRINLTIWPFLLSGLLALFIALLTVSWQAIRAATANPVESLRYE
jgi:putative ABC transport system permease protein